MQQTRQRQQIHRKLRIAQRQPRQLVGQQHRAQPLGCAHAHQTGRVVIIHPLGQGRLLHPAHRLFHGLHRRQQLLPRLGQLERPGMAHKQRLAHDLF